VSRRFVLMATVVDAARPEAVALVEGAAALDPTA
jgi:hypothetical protein